MAERRFVLVQALGPRVSWPTLRRKALEALSSAMEDKIRGGKMNRRQKSGVMELADEDLANTVAKHLDGLVDSQTDPTPWKARTIDEAEAGPLLNGADPPPLAESRASSGSKSPPARKKENAKVDGSDGDTRAGRSHSDKRRSPSARDDRKRPQSPDRKRERSRSRSPDRKRERSRSRKRERSRSRRRRSPSPRRKSNRSRSRSRKRRSRSRRR
eukprot:TRINITY_DN76341_c0_g1_i1.p1 TRINITY_DN76341_c0_g1~~TRINITY_DN76341_c0_g1_i1.p1  ORF type:complete len:235 (+),score=23.89 TRINITY_DN76341_c0_g1_i1:64-705(+)